jgi:Fic family protein
MVIAIGHKFGDLNISSPIRAFIEKPNSNVTIINDKAEEIKSSIFNNHPNIQAVQQKIENWLPNGIDTIKTNIENVQKQIKEKIEKDRKQRAEFEEKIRERVKQELEANKPPSLATSSGLLVNPFNISSVQYRICPYCSTFMIPNDKNCCPSCGNPLQ